LETNAGEGIPALTQLPPQGDYTPVADEHLTQTMPCIPLSAGPKWNFDPRLQFQPLVKSYTRQKLAKRFEEFREKYGYSRLSWGEFQQAAFCLVGLKVAGFISFISGQEDDRARPLATVEGWTIDCFLARYKKFVAFIDHMKFAQCPNPIYWLEAELEDESRLKRKGLGFQVVRPWKGLVAEKAVLAVVDVGVFAPSRVGRN
jgi:hypothetical protein